eukprot:scaffold286193_cov31-Tisochrysis_lutea.AAC.1
MLVRLCYVLAHSSALLQALNNLKQRIKRSRGHAVFTDRPEGLLPTLSTTASSTASVDSTSTAELPGHHPANRIRRSYMSKLSSFHILPQYL